MASAPAISAGTPTSFVAATSPTLSSHALVLGPGAASDFRGLVREPGTVGLLPLDALIDRVGGVAGEGAEWTRGLRGRYARI